MIFDNPARCMNDGINRVSPSFFGSFRVMKLVPPSTIHGSVKRRCVIGCFASTYNVSGVEFSVAFGR